MNTTESMQLSTREVLANVARERYEKYTYAIVDEFPNPYQFEERVALGTFSYTTSKTKRRFLLSHSSFDHLAAGIPQTPPEIARDYLDYRYPRKLRASGEQAELLLYNRNAPLHYRPFTSKNASYVDLQGAFWWLMGTLGWNVDYHPRKFLSPGRAPSDFPLPNHKLARNCLVTAGLSNPISVWTGHKMIEESPYNIHLNYGLWSAIMDTLHMIGLKALDCGAYYVNTDGYILPDRSLPEFLGYLSGLHAPYRIKGYGQTLVTGIGSYQVGDYQTKRFAKEFARPTSNLRRSNNPAMLEMTFQQIAADRVDFPALFMR